MSDAHARQKEAVSTIQTVKLPTGAKPQEFGPRQSAADTSSPFENVDATGNDGERFAGQSMRQLDETMAVEADQLLQGGFESVEEVLAGESNAAGDRGEKRRGAGYLDSQGASPELIPARDGTAEAKSVTGDQGAPGHETESTPTANDPEPVPQQAEPIEGDDTDKPNAENHAGDAAVDDATSKPESVEENAPEAVVDDGSAEATAPSDEEVDEHDAETSERDEALAVNSVGQDDSEVDETSSDKPAEHEAEIGEPHQNGHVRSMIQKGLFAAAIVLAFVSLPLRFVPDSLRPLVDWLALSLIFWVPIVWVIAIVLA